MNVMMALCPLSPTADVGVDRGRGAGEHEVGRITRAATALASFITPLIDAMTVPVPPKYGSAVGPTRSGTGRHERLTTVGGSRRGGIGDRRERRDHHGQDARRRRACGRHRGADASGVSTAGRAARFERNREIGKAP
jgi:hypothetical protein